MNYKSISEFEHGSMESTGVLLCNLGSPDAPTPAALRRYLGEFLWDPRVIEMPRPLWWLILHGFILRFRPKRSAHSYQSVWTDEGSPLVVTSSRQAAALQQVLESRMKGPVKVELAMRYGNPSIKDALQKLQQANVRRLLVLPLYPQYSSTTTASVFDALFDELKTWRIVPELRQVNHYHDHEDYIAALANSIKEEFDANGQPERLLISFHGTPKRYLNNGDPYHCECHKTARLLAEKLGLNKGQWQLTFQSRFGKEEWLKPYTDKTLEQLAKEGIKHVALVCPGFSADCLETLEEIEVENRDVFLGAGGELFHYIPALNDRGDHIDALANIVMQHTQGWAEVDSEWNASQVMQMLERRSERAQAMGAER